MTPEEIDEFRDMDLDSQTANEVRTVLLDEIERLRELVASGHAIVWTHYSTRRGWWFKCQCSAEPPINSQSYWVLTEDQQSVALAAHIAELRDGTS